MNQKVWKENGKKHFKRNYWKSVAVCLILSILIGGTSVLTYKENIDINITEEIPLHNIEGKSNSDIVNDFINGVTENETVHQRAGVLGNIFNNVSKSGSFLFGILNACNQFLFHDRVMAGIVIIIGSILGLGYWFFSRFLEVGKNRFFLENHGYQKTHINRLLAPYKVRRTLNVSWAMFVKNVYQFLWIFTILGGPIKFYAYRMVPYLLAENPNLKANEVIALSQKMMKNHKWELFLFDLSFFGYYLLGIITVNISNVFYLNPYKDACMAEYYFYLRGNVKKDYPNVFLDDNLEKEGLEYPEEEYFLPEHKSRLWLKKLDYERNYSISTYILLFFIFSFLGWIWEVSITLFGEGIFVNRGTFWGPWLPIYGSGGILILFLLKKIRRKPWMTFFFTMLICGVVEYGTAWYLETFKHLKWWDYTGYLLNIQGRICLEGLLFFGIGGMAFIYILAPFFDNLLKKVSSKIKVIVCIILVLCFLIDIQYSKKHPNVGAGITTEIVQKE